MTKKFLNKNPIFRGGGGVYKKTIYRGNCLKKEKGEAWTVCRFKGGGLVKKGVFLKRG